MEAFRLPPNYPRPGTLTRGELVKECLTIAMETLFSEKGDVIRLAEQVAMSCKPRTKHTDDLAKQLKNPFIGT